MTMQICATLDIPPDGVGSRVFGLAKVREWVRTSWGVS